LGFPPELLYRVSLQDLWYGASIYTAFQPGVYPAVGEKFEIISKKVLLDLNGFMHRLIYL
jgi:hypothetical protein